ncbi:MAG: hypothetical protein WCK74_11480 [Gemmatimonadaceae bacterium]
MRTHHSGRPAPAICREHARARAADQRAGSALLECLVALVLLACLGLLLVSSARMVAWSGQLDRLTMQASARVMAVSDSGSLPHCAPAASDEEATVASDAVSTRVTMTRDDEPLDQAVVAHGAATLAMTRIPVGTLAPPPDAARVRLPWQAAWWCPL